MCHTCVQWSIAFISWAWTQVPIITCGLPFKLVGCVELALKIDWRYRKLKCNNEAYYWADMLSILSCSDLNCDSFVWDIRKPAVLVTASHMLNSRFRLIWCFWYIKCLRCAVWSFLYLCYHLFINKLRLFFGIFNMSWCMNFAVCSSAF